MDHTRIIELTVSLNHDFSESALAALFAEEGVLTNANLIDMLKSGMIGIQSGRLLE